MFNDILNSGTFPTDWNIGVIKSVYKKKGDKRSPANYRGITLTSCLGKLFTSILQSRLKTYMEKHKILNSEQFGFLPNSGTTDSLFILQQIIHKYTKQHKKLYVEFIDYEKAFDSVWQYGMLYKLYKYGIKDKFFKVMPMLAVAGREFAHVRVSSLPPFPSSFWFCNDVMGLMHITSQFFSSSAAYSMKARLGGIA